MPADIYMPEAEMQSKLMKCQDCVWYDQIPVKSDINGEEGLCLVNPPKVGGEELIVAHDSRCKEWLRDEVVNESQI